jgi:hypothetical protein
MKVAKASIEASEILRRWQSAAAGTAPATNARVRYLNSLMTGRTVQFAERLVAADPEVDTGSALARLWEEGLRPSDSKLIEFLAKSLVESRDDSPQQKRLADSIRRVPEFQVSLVPAINKSVESMKELPEAQVERIKKLLESLKPLPLSSSPQNLGLGNYPLGYPYGNFVGLNGTITPTVSAPSRRNWEDMDWMLTLILLAGAGLVLCGVFLYNGDLPPNVTILQRLIRRILSLVGDASIIAFFGGIQASTRKMLRSSSKPANGTGVPWMQLWLFIPWGIFASLHQYFPPVTFTAQAIVFLFNLPFTVMCVYLLQRD